MMKPIGVYIHVPFCAKKCPYCDFYSRTGNETAYDTYTDMLMKKIVCWGEKLNRNADTLYFGGGTPSLLGAERLVTITALAGKYFGNNIKETTVEVNPSKEDFDFEKLMQGGINRISVGLQSANDNELEFLGRQHNTAQAKKCINAAKNAGFENISLDLMIALPNQTKSSLERSVDFCAEQGAKHISAYILKIEPKTVFYKNREKLHLPDDDEAAEMYEVLCELMKQYGYTHYEISNFCKRGYESRHNLKYWHDEEYIGIGPSAHSFIDGKRFYCPGKIKSFEEDESIFDGDGGGEEEFIMLGLRLSEGITNQSYMQRFGKAIPDFYIKNAQRFEKTGLVRMTDNGFTLTEKGFMVSNSLITEILT